MDFAGWMQDLYGEVYVLEPELRTHSELQGVMYFHDSGAGFC